VRLLDELGMQLSPDKSSKGAFHTNEGILFLGVEILPGIIRPSAKARQRFLSSITGELERAQKAFFGFRDAGPMQRSHSLISTLKRVEGMVDGWGKHYWFCNDMPTLERLDAKVSALVGDFLGAYRHVSSRLPHPKQSPLLGIPLLAEQKRRPFNYPSLK
jgi:RNA-directed DNA polymerase